MQDQLPPGTTAKSLVALVMWRAAQGKIGGKVTISSTECAEVLKQIGAPLLPSLVQSTYGALIRMSVLEVHRNPDGVNAVTTFKVTFSDIEPDQKLMFLYLFTNRRVKPCGAFELGVRTISNETGLTAVTVVKACAALNEQVRWWQGLNCFFIPGFVRGHPKTSVVSIVKSLSSLPPVITSAFVAIYPGIDLSVEVKRSHAKISPKKRTAVYSRDSSACVYCGSGINLTLDHVVPQSRGGSHKIDNLVTACSTCNSSKGARTPEEWLH